MTYQKYSTFCIDIFEKGYCFEIRHTLHRHDRHLVYNSGSARAWVRAETPHEFEQNIWIINVHRSCINFNRNFVILARYLWAERKDKLSFGTSTKIPKKGLLIKSFRVNSNLVCQTQVSYIFGISLFRLVKFAVWKDTKTFSDTFE